MRFVRLALEADPTDIALGAETSVIRIPSSRGRHVTGKLTLTRESWRLAHMGLSAVDVRSWARHGL